METEDKAKLKQSFQMNKNYYNLIKFLSNEEKGLWIDAIFKHEIYKQKTDFKDNKLLMSAYEFAIGDLTNNDRKYNEACIKKSNAKKSNWNSTKEKPKKTTTPTKNNEETEEQERINREVEDYEREQKEEREKEREERERETKKEKEEREKALAEFLKRASK